MRNIFSILFSLCFFIVNSQTLKFIDNALEKVRQTKNMITQKGLNTLIEVDGGVNDITGKALIDAGADVLVAGSFVFNSENPSKTIDVLKAL